MRKRFISLAIACLMLLPLLPYRAIAAGAEAGSASGFHDVSWNPIPAAVEAYLNQVEYDPSDYTTSRIDAYAPGEADFSNIRPVGYPLTVPDGTLCRGEYRQAVEAGQVTVYNDIPNRSTPYTVRSAAGDVVQTGTLTPRGGALRLIYCPKAVNIRDLGGWACDGGTVRYGMLFRGGNLTEKDKDVMLNQLGILHELDLRGKEEAVRKPSVLKDDIDYTVLDSCVWYSLRKKDLWRQMIGVVFECVEKNRPVYFHCAGGADRTGTLACVLEALLGMSQSDIDKDYELTSFAMGTGTDEQARRRNEPDWTKLIQAINERSGSTFRDRAVAFVLELGFSIDEINAFRAAMTDGTPEKLTPPASLVPAPTPLPSPVLAFDNPFQDVEAGQYYTDAVLWAVNHDPQITAGTSAATFAPAVGCTRGQMVTFLWRAAGCPEPKAAENPFEDVQSDDYYYRAVLWAVENGITNGTGKTTFRPLAPVTRGQTVTFLWRMEGQPEVQGDLPFRDVMTNQFYWMAVLWAVQCKLTNGTSRETFSPNSLCSRAQIVTFLYRAMA